jgi:uncharacterized protein YqjF (DUF2071 family)
MTLARDEGTVRYASSRRWPRPRPAACELRYEPIGPVRPAAVGTLAHFLVERYILYAFARGRLFSGRVHHAPYPLQDGRVTALDESLLAAAGLRRPEEPPLVHYASGVDVELFALDPARNARAS